MGASVAMSGPALIQVGERSPKDKKYQTREVVLAPPGTVVAPMPKGMEPTHENGMALVLSQLLKQGKAPKGGAGTMAGMAFGGTMGDTVDPTWELPDTSTGANAVAPPPVGAAVASSLPVYSYTAPNNGLDFSAAGNLADTASNYDLGLKNYNLGTKRLGLDTTVAGQNYAMAQAAQALNELTQKQNYSLGQQQLGVSRDTLNETAQRDQQQYQLGLKQLDEAMQEVQMQVASQEMIAQMQHQLGVDTLAETTRNNNLLNTTANRQLDIQSADDEFNRIMRGVSEASVTGAGARGVASPTTGLL